MTREVEGFLTGEFLKINGAPDGRCRFAAKDNSLVFLCFFKNGRKLKGPQVKFEPKKKKIEIRSKSMINNSQIACTLAVIEKDKPGMTGYFVDQRLVDLVPYVERRTLNWLLEDQEMNSTSPVKFDGAKIGDFNQNKLNGRGISIDSLGGVSIGYYKDNCYAPGINLFIYIDGTFAVGDTYMKYGEEEYRNTQYKSDGTIFRSNYHFPALVPFANLSTDFDDLQEDLVFTQP